MRHLNAPRHLPPANSRQRIGLFGGSFNPPHPGHLHVAKTALKRLDLDQVWWVPARGNPLKSETAPFEHRLSAIQALLADNPAMRVSDIERHANLTYTVDLVRLWKMRCPDAHLVWIMGADSLATFHRWKQWRALAGMIAIAVVSRPGSSMAPLNSPFARIYATSRLPSSRARALATSPAPVWTYLTAPLDPNSSTAIRAARKH